MGSSLIVVDISEFEVPGRPSVAERAITEEVTVIIEQDKKPVLVMLSFHDWSAISVAAFRDAERQLKGTGL